MDNKHHVKNIEEETELLSQDVVLSRLGNIKKILNDIESVSGSINKTSSFVDLKSFLTKFYEITESSQGIFNLNEYILKEKDYITDINQNYKDHKEKAKDIINELEKQCLVIRNNLEYASDSGINSPSYLLRRFDSFDRSDEIYYFKQSHINIKSKNTILLRGLKLCGLKIQPIERLKCKSNRPTRFDTMVAIP